MSKILAIEDNIPNMKLVVMLLEKAGHKVIQARDAEAGLILAEKNQPDLILLDIQLPGMDGLAAAAILKKHESTRQIPIIALTALAMKGDKERILAAGCDGYIPKPTGYQDFLTEVQNWLPKS